MSMDVAEVERALLALSQHDRAAVIRRGLRSLDKNNMDADPDATDKAWRSEVRRRLASIEDGSAELLDPEQSHAALRAELASRRQ
ncbi:addiction module protein [Brevibacterium luteolum]|uniref:addiction module protein n=1 Tax=Brevibacterium luteolum TaxID=199591 RepID=UPI00223B10CE|nr:addiction module protein [Brevibacterium luteolum]MCT1657127.1 addiction module protein [Brevibacterium luteolum]